MNFEFWEDYPTFNDVRFPNITFFWYVASVLSLTGKRWQLQNDTPLTDASALMSFLREGRGLMDEDLQWHDPSVYPDAAKAAERVLEGSKRHETMGIFGDYDCDGITATAQMLRALRRHGVEPIVRLPHRVHDGYGLKPAHIDEFHTAGVTLIITVDTGISAHEAIEYARGLGIDVIVLDHHHIRSVPDAYAIMHPGLVSGLAEPHPAAAGVVFTFLHALEGDTWKERDIDLALATFGTVADLVPLRGVNRRLVQEGLRALRRLPEGPIKTLIDHVSGGQPLTSVDVAFRIAPRINAAGRLADPMLALRALLEGGELLRDLETLNVLRQEETQSALLRAEAELPDELPAFLSIASSTYQPGILGLLAGKLTERHGRPSMAVTIRGDECTASFRSPPGYNIVKAIEECAHLMKTFGGHAQAAGATFELKNLLTFTEALEAHASLQIPEEARTPTLSIDAVIAAETVTHDFCSALQSLEPYGQGNPEPVFLLTDVNVHNARRVGGDGRHLQAMLGQSKLIGFGLGEFLDKTTQSLDIACRIGIDTWNGKKTPQLFVQDVRVSTGKPRLSLVSEQKTSYTRNTFSPFDPPQGPTGVIL